MENIKEAGAVKICPHKHTAYQPTNDHWRCPKCGSRDFESAPEFEFSEDDCGMLHTKDYCQCNGCGYYASGAVVAKRLAALDKVKTCPCCNGRGVVAE